MLARSQTPDIEGWERGSLIGKAPPPQKRRPIVDIPGKMSSWEWIKRRVFNYLLVPRREINPRGRHSSALSESKLLAAWELQTQTPSVAVSSLTSHIPKYPPPPPLTHPRSPSLPSSSGRNVCNGTVPWGSRAVDCWLCGACQARTPASCLRVTHQKSNTTTKTATIVISTHLASVVSQWLYLTSHVWPM